MTDEGHGGLHELFVHGEVHEGHYFQEELARKECRLARGGEIFQFEQVETTLQRVRLGVCKPRNILASAVYPEVRDRVIDGPINL